MIWLQTYQLKYALVRDDSADTPGGRVLDIVPKHSVTLGFCSTLPDDLHFLDQLRALAVKLREGHLFVGQGLPFLKDSIEIDLFIGAVKGMYLRFVSQIHFDMRPRCEIAKLVMTSGCFKTII